MDELRWLTFDLFENRVGEEFEVALPSDGRVALVLTGAREGSEPGGRGPEGEPRRQFSLDFGGPREPVLPQATYAVRHDQLGDLELFLVPMGQDEEGMTYEAAFA